MSKTDHSKLCITLALSALTFGQAHANWTYHVRVDSFDDNEIKTATLRGSQFGATLSVTQSQKGVNLISISSSSRFDCFPDCVVRVKFDQAPPVSFAAMAPRIVSSTVFIKDHDEFLRLISKASRVVVRAPMVRYSPDLEFEISNPFDPASWDTARVLQAKQKKCQDNAVNEDFSTCMSRP